jgi:hypothetical protein
MCMYFGSLMYTLIGTHGIGSGKKPNHQAFFSAPLQHIVNIF